MSSIPNGDWAIECILVNDETVMNNGGMRALEILENEWVIQPAGQRFKIIQLTPKSAVLESEGGTYYADFQVDANKLSLQLSRPNVKEKIKIAAEAITADVYVGVL